MDDLHDGSGREMGKSIVELVGSGKVGLFIATSTQLNIQRREGPPGKGMP